MTRKNFLVSILMIAFCCACSEKTGNPLPTVGDPLPEFTLSLDDGSSLTSREISEATVGMIVFFHTTCPDCRRELPVIDEFHKTHPGKMIVAVSRAQSADEIAGWWEDKGITLPYSAQNDRKIYSLFSESGIPCTVICRSGIISAIFSDDHIFTQEELEVLMAE